MTNKPERMFYAYASYPTHIGESIENFTTEFNKSGECEIFTWRNMDTAGLAITPEILKNIDSCEIFACDLTTLNLNVLFELGYAISKNKKIWITINGELEDSIQNYQNFRLMRNVSYFNYANSSDLLKEFYNLQIFRQDRQTLAMQRELFVAKDYIDVFVLKAQSRLDIINAPIEILRSSGLKVIFDDPDESSFYPIEWYCRNIYSAYGVYIQFMGDDQVNRLNHNTKAALLCGIALGLEKYTLFVSKHPFTIPSDLPDLIQTFQNLKKSKSLVSDWLNDLVVVKSERENRRQDYEEQSARLAKLGLIRLGEIVAENEAENLSNYFIPTAAYNEIVYGSQSIFVGRKGTGKSANLLAAFEYFSKEKSNLIILFNPVGYEIESVLGLLTSIKDVQRRGFFADSLWKYLIYTEIAENVSRRFRQSFGATPDRDEQMLLDLLEKNPYMISDSFSERLSYVMDAINNEIYQHPHKDIRENISSVLHSQLVSVLKRYLNPILEKYRNLIILVDNLDKGWSADSDTRALTDILFSLISLPTHLPQEISREVRSKINLNVKMTIFLRSDIYSIMQEYAREKDKLVVQKIEWDNAEMLGRVLDKRITFASGIASPVDAWREFFKTKNDGEDIKEFVITHTRPRPRDVIVLVTYSIGSAVNCGHPKVEQSDLEFGLKNYSNWVYDSLIEEDDPSRNQLDLVVDKFIDEKIEFKESEVREIISSVCGNKADQDYYFDLLCDANFFEICLKDNEYIVVSDRAERLKALKFSRKRAERIGNEVTLRINRPFRLSLGIEDS